MKEKLIELINQLKAENQVREQNINSNELLEYDRTVTISQYNNTLNIIQRLEKI